MIRGDEARVVEDLYRVFVRYDLNGQLHVCDCKVCCSKEDRAALIRTPVREISCALLSEFTNAVFGGDESEVKHFLPRYFDLILGGEIPCHLDLECAFARLLHYDWLDKWPLEEASVTQRGFEAIALAAATEGGPLTTRAGETLITAIACGINGRANIGGMLLAASSVPTRFASVQIASVIADTWHTPLFPSPDDATTSPENGYDWRGENEAAIAWLESPALRERLNAAFWESGDPKDQQILSDAVAAIERDAASLGRH